MESKPDTIKVSASHKEEIAATHADLHVTIQGSSLFSSNEALKKAKEVSQLVEALIGFGVKSESITLQGVHIEGESGRFLKSSSAIYRLKVRCEDLGHFAGLLDIIGLQKNTTIERVEWKYNEDEARERGLNMALEKAKSRAAKVATNLGVKLLGVYDLIENTYDEEAPPMFHAQAAMVKTRAAVNDQPGLGMDIQHNKNIHVNLEIWYRVSAF